MADFPFKPLKLYRVKKKFTSLRSGDEFDAGRRVVYLESETNRYEGIEICSFKDFDSGHKLILHATESFLEAYNEFLEEIPYPT